MIRKVISDGGTLCHYYALCRLLSPIALLVIQMYCGCDSISPFGEKVQHILLYDHPVVHTYY